MLINSPNLLGFLNAHSEEHSLFHITTLPFYQFTSGRLMKCKAIHVTDGNYHYCGKFTRFYCLQCSLYNLGTTPMFLCATQEQFTNFHNFSVPPTSVCFTSHVQRPRIMHKMSIKSLTMTRDEVEA